jgi:UDPglucose 6-dehydrogenase
MKIAVIGTGYVGLVTGTCFAETGNDVTCVDIDEVKVQQMQDGHIPIYEPGLETLFQRNIEQQRLQFTTDLSEGVKGAQVIFLALPTPPGDDGAADLRYVLQVGHDLGPLLEDYTVIVDKSTVPVGTADKVWETISANTQADFDVISNPEFLREGHAVDDFMKPDRVVIGASSQRARELMDSLYQPFIRQGNPIIFMDERSAEMTKYAANAFLATKITFMNEIANLCEQVGANVDAIRKGLGTDERIGKRFLFPGIGFGGSCFPKDVQALQKTADDYNYDFQILNSVMNINEKQKTTLIPKLLEHYNHDLTGKNIAIWGLAFKPDTDDIREAPALYIIDELLKLGAHVKAYDPEAMDNVYQLHGDMITYGQNPYEILSQADALLLVTEWPVFRNPDFKHIHKMMREPLILDGRNIYNPESMEQHGFHYRSIGRSTKNLESKNLA